MLHRASDVLHKSLCSSPTDQAVWTAAEGVTATGFCLCERLPTHDDVGRPCPKHAAAAYMVWEYASGRGPSLIRLKSYALVQYLDADNKLHRIDGLPARFTVDFRGVACSRQWYVRAEKLSDDIHLMDRLYWDEG